MSFDEASICQWADAVAAPHSREVGVETLIAPQRYYRQLNAINALKQRPPIMLLQPLS